MVGLISSISLLKSQNNEKPFSCGRSQGNGVYLQLHGLEYHVLSSEYI